MTHRTNLIAGMGALTLGLTLGFIQIYHPGLFQPADNVAFVTQSVETNTMDTNLIPSTPKLSCLMQGKLHEHVLAVSVSIYADGVQSALPLEYAYYNQARVNSQDASYVASIDAKGQGFVENIKKGLYSIHGMIRSTNGDLINCSSMDIEVF